MARQPVINAAPRRAAALAGVVGYGGTRQGWRGLASALEDGVEAYIKSGI